jgi:hypothetical protein
VYDYPEFIIGLGDLDIANVRWKGVALVENFDYAIYTDDVSVKQDNNNYTLTATFLTLFSIPTELNSLGFDSSGGVANLTVDVNGFRSIANLTTNKYFRLNTISSNSVDRNLDICYRGKIYDPTQQDANKADLSRFLYWANFDSPGIDTTSAYSDFVAGSPGSPGYDWSVAVYADSIFGSPNIKNFYRHSPYRGTGSFRLKATGAFAIYPAEYDVVYSAPSYFKSLSIFSQYTVDNEGSNNWETWYTRGGSPTPGYIYIETVLDSDTFIDYLEDPSGLKNRGSGLLPTLSYTAAIHTANVGSPITNVSQPVSKNIITGNNAPSLRDYYHNFSVGSPYYDMSLYTNMNPFNISSSFEMVVRLLFDYVFSNIESPYTKTITLGSPNIIGSPGSPVSSSAGKLKVTDPYLLNYIYEDQVVIVEKLAGNNVPQALNDNNTSTYGYYRIKNLTVRHGYLEDYNIIVNDPTIYIEFNLAEKESRDTITLTPGSPGVGVGSFKLHTSPLIDNNESFKAISNTMSWIRVPAAEFKNFSNNGELIVKDPSGNIVERREQVGDAELRTLYDFGKLDSYSSEYNIVPVSYGPYPISGAGSPTVYVDDGVTTIELAGSPLAPIGEIEVLPMNLQQIGTVINTERTVGQILRGLVAPMNINYYFDAQGAIKFFKFYPPDMAYNELTKAEKLEIDNDASRYVGMNDIKFNSVRMIASEPMISSVEYKARRNFTQQNKDALAGMVIDQGKAEQFANEYLTTISEINDLNANIDPSLFAKKEVVQSFNYDPVEASYNAKRRINIRKQPRMIVSLEVVNRYDINVGDIIYVAFNRYGLYKAIGEPIITDLGEDLVTEVLEIILTAWAGGYTFVRSLVLSTDFDHTANTLRLEVWL